MRRVLAATLAGSCLISGAVRADQNGAGAATATGTTHDQPAAELQEIVVTAEKRVSTVQQTPISITAISGSQIQAEGISDLLTIAQQVPGVSFKTSGPGQTEFVIRGLTATGGESPTVGFYLDETALSPPAMSKNGKVFVDTSLFDLNRVEILRGPQG
ncbi:MAG: TonB-dependent receptor plug domain-containing protein, partial [Steroidobacteraceae bacterium]